MNGRIATAASTIALALATDIAAAQASDLSWNSSHPTKGCSVDGLKSTGGAGYLYCFAAD